MKKGNKAPMIVSILILGGAVGNLLRTHALDTIRAVDALTLVAAGMAIGVLLVTVISSFKKEP
ncbi:MAG: hypothetical protein ACHQF2_10360 [Flavobacteriales bacterium]